MTWSIAPQVGTILSTGLYIAPNVITSNQTIIVTATSTVNSSFANSATITLTPPSIVVTPIIPRCPQTRRSSFQPR